MEKNRIEDFTKTELESIAEIYTHLKLPPDSFNVIFNKCIKALDDKDINDICDIPDIGRKIRALCFSMCATIDDVKKDFINDMIEIKKYKQNEN